MPDFTQPDNKCRLTIWQKCPLLILLRVSKSPSAIKNPLQKIIDIIWRKSVLKLMERFMILKELFTVKFLFDSCTKRRVMKMKFLYINFFIYLLRSIELYVFSVLLAHFYTSSDNLFIFYNFFFSISDNDFEMRHDKNMCINLFTKCQQFVIFLMVFFKLGMKRCINY